MGQYDKILDEEKGATPTPSNQTPYDSVLDDEVQQNQARTRTIYEKALTVNPDQAAQAKKLAGATGLAPDIVSRNLDEVKRKEQARALDLIRLAADSPVLARQLMDPTFTNQTHDDLSTLGSIEQFIRDTGSSVKAGVYNANKGTAGVFQAGFEFAAPALDPLENVAPGGNPLRRIAEGFALSGQGADALAKAATPKTESTLSGGFQSGIQSLTQNVLMLPMAFLPGGQGAALTGMVSLTGGQSYQDARAMGLSMSQALPFAASQAAIEYATEKLPLDALVGGIKQGAPFLQSLAKQMALEIPGEQIATALQDMNEWAVLNPGKPFNDYLAERPNAALQTLIATVVGTGGNVVIASGVQAATNRLMGDAYDAGQAEHSASYLQQQLALAGQALLRERNPSEFRALVQKMSEESDGAPKEVFVDAEVLNQLAPEVIAALPESVRAALPDALWANDSVAIPVADVLTVAPGTPLEQMLIENARIGDPRAMSQKEAKDAGAKAQEYLSQESARVIQQAQDQAATQASSDAVRQNVLDQLNGVGRFRKEVNEGYATWTAAFYTTLAGRMGMTPEQMAAQYPLKIVGQGQGALEQTESTPAFKAWFGDSKVVDKTGKPLVVYHGSPDARFVNEDGVFSTLKDRMLKYGNTPESKRDAELGRAFFFTTSKAVANSYTDDSRAFDYQNAEAGVIPAHVSIKNPLEFDAGGAHWREAQKQISKDDFIKRAKKEGHDGVIIRNVHDSYDSMKGGKDPLSDVVVAFKPTQIKRAEKNQGAYDPNDPSILKQGGARGTFNPANLELALNDTADLSTFLHETGHFFLEVMDDLASQPNAPADIAGDMEVLMKWFGIKGKNTYQGMTEDEYIARINPEGKAREFTEAAPASTFAELTPTGPAYTTVGGVTLAPGEDGAVLAIVDGKVVGYMAPESGTTGLFVADEFRKRGIGEALSTFYRTRNPLALSGGFSVGGEAVARKVFRKLATRENGPIATWRAMTLGEKRPYHERFAESMEQYLMEGKAPSVELQPLFRKFRAWLLNVYKSLKAFIASRNSETGVQLSSEVRQVFDRMLASEEQIAQANEVAGLLPDEDADYAAVEKLTARSLRDLKWTVNARAKEIKKLQAQAKTLRKEVEAEVRAEVDAMPVFQARAALDKLRKENKAQPNDMELAIVSDSFQFPTVEDMLREIDAAGHKADVIEGMTDQRMLERHGDLIDQRAVEAAANEAVHNEARARSLATELKSQGEMLNARTDTGQTSTNGSKITVSALAEAAKQFGANVVSKTPLKDLKAKAWQHTAAERRAGKRWQAATAAGKTQEAVKAKQDQMLNNAAAKAAVDAQAEMRKMLEFFKRVIKDGNEKTVEKGRDPDVVNAARAVLGAYGIAPKGAKSANDYMTLVGKNDPAMFAALQPSVQGALDMAQPLDALTMDQLRGLHEEIQGMWYLAKRSRQMEIDGDMMDMDDAESQLQDRMQVLGVPDSMPGDSGAVTTREEFARKLQHAASLLRRTEQWAQGMGSEFTKLVFQPVKDAADHYRSDRVAYRKKYQALVDAVAPALLEGQIAAPELGYTFGRGHNGIGHAELLHAILHTGNESNKRKLLLGRSWATQKDDGTLDTTKWDAFIKRAHDTGILNKAHYDFAQGVWDLLEETKPLAQKTHRDVFGRYFSEVTADAFATPFGEYKGGYVPAQADPRIVADADLRKLAELENENMSFSFPNTNKGFTKSRVEYNRPLMLDLRTIGQHIDKVLLFSHMEPAVRDVNKLLSRKGVSYSLSRIDPTIYAGMLTPWLNRSARQIVETPVVGDGGISRVLSAARSRAGMGLMFANVSNTIQQITGFSSAALKVKPASMMASTAQFIASPKKMAKAVSGASEFMANRMDNEISAINDAMDKILLDPNLYERAQAWTQKHAYFMQTAMANTMEPIIWTAAYNEALQNKQSERDAVRHADSVIRTTQGSSLPEDVSRIETGPAYARVFTQFIGYFNMLANTNATALKQLAQEEGLRKGAGKALGIVTVGMLIPLWVAEAIAVAMRGGPDDPDKDGYLDDWLAAVFGMGTIKGTFAMVPFVGALATASMNRFNGNPADDKMSLSPVVGILEAAAGVPMDVYKAITDPDKLNRRNAVRDVASAVSIATGFPASAIARPVGYLAGVADNKINPTSAIDAVRGTVTGTPSPGSK